LHDRVLPVCEHAGIALEGALTDKWPRVLGPAAGAPYELYLAVQQPATEPSGGPPTKYNGSSRKLLALNPHIPPR